MEDSDDLPKVRKRKAPKKITPRYLKNVVNWYLERYDAPKAHVRRLMMQRVRRGARHHDQDLEECTEHLDTLLEELCRLGVIDDDRYARNTIERQRGSGKARRHIEGYLRSRGVASSTISHAFEDLDADIDHDPERIAAIRYARKRRFGPWCHPPERRQERRDKQLASMVRAGYSFSLAKEILAEDDADMLEMELPIGW